MNPLVSICCVTYNHAPFIRQCLDGFLIQETTFPVEILIHDDASTDGTDNIIREYAEKYPEMIFPLYEEENQYSKPNHQHMDLYNYSRARGKYIAYCEGDDYWTDPLKLQKQVDFLEAYPDYSVCWHEFTIIDNECNRVENITGKEFGTGNSDGMVVTEDDIFSNRFMQPLTMVFRRSVLDLDNMRRFKYYVDTQEVYFLLKGRKGYVMYFNGGCYRRHPGGVSSGRTNRMYCEKELPADREFYWKTRNKWAKKYYLEALELCVQEFKQDEKMKAVLSALEYAFVSGHPKSLIRHFKVIFSSR